MIDRTKEIRRLEEALAASEDVIRREHNLVKEAREQRERCRAERDEAVALLRETDGMLSWSGPRVSEWQHRVRALLARLDDAGAGEKP